MSCTIRTYLTLADLRMLRSAAEQLASSIADDCSSCRFRPDKCPTCKQSADIAKKLTDVESLVEVGAVGIITVEQGGAA